MTFPLKTSLVILSSWSPPMIGGPVLLYNLLCQLPSDKYRILTDSRLMATGIDPNTWLPCEYSFVDRPHITKADIIAKAEIHTKDTVPMNTPAGLGLFHWILWRIINIRIFSPFVRLAGLIRNTRHFIKAFRNVPRSASTVLLGISDNGPALLATYYLSRRYNLPYYYYLFDLYRGNCFAPMDVFIAKLLERRILTRAQKVIVNNQGTVEHLKNLYGSKVKMEVICNSVFPEKYPPMPEKCEIKPPYEIIFTGNISWAQESSLQNLLKAASLLTDLPLTITLYTNRPPATILEEAARHSNVRLTYAPYSKMPEIQSRASLLFLPLAWNTKGPDIIATATPGKFTDYLAVGRPMLIHAPDYSYISRYGKEKNLGLIVDKNSVPYLAKTIREFLLRPDLALTYVQNARKVFKENHDARKNAKKLTEILEMV